jgi:hypothetical protein
VQANCQIVRDKVIAFVMGHCDRVPEFRRALVDATWAEMQGRGRRQSLAVRNLDAEIAELERRSANLAEAIAKGGQLEALLSQLAEVDRNLQDAQRRRSDPTQAEPLGPTLSTRADVERHLEVALRQLAETSFAFGDLMRRILPEFTIMPVQALDNGQVHPRARFVLNLSALQDRAPAAGEPDGHAGDVIGALNLFEPPGYIRAIPACLAAKQADPEASLSEIAAKTGHNRLMVRRALNYARQMAAEGVSDLYRELTKCPPLAARWRRRGAARAEISQLV